VPGPRAIKKLVRSAQPGLGFRPPFVPWASFRTTIGRDTLPGDDRGLKQRRQTIKLRATWSPPFHEMSVFACEMLDRVGSSMLSTSPAIATMR